MINVRLIIAHPETSITRTNLRSPELFDIFHLFG